MTISNTKLVFYVMLVEIVTLERERTMENRCAKERGGGIPASVCAPVLPSMRMARQNSANVPR